MTFFSGTFILLAAWQAAAPPYRQSGFESAEQAGWRTWSARAEIAPKTWVDPAVGLGAAGSLAISGNGNAAAHGGWELPLDGVAPGSWYRFRAAYRASGVKAERWQVVARLDWRTAEGKRAGQPDYVHNASREAGWTRLESTTQAPANANRVVVQLYLSNAPQGSVWWDDIAFEPVGASAARPVVIAAIHLRPSRTGTAAESVRQFVETVDRTVKGKTDVILLPEGITVIGTGKRYAEVAEPVPGPTTKTLGELARRHNAWIVAGIYEREAPAIYNTAVLIDRNGQIAGKYRKVYLPREEVESGLTPGDEYPVFRTDFGTVGMMICYDVFFADPARALALRGAELILMPIWGGDQTLGKARAIENRVFLATSGYDYPTYVMDPDGEVLTSAEHGQAAVTTIDLNKRYLHTHLGDMRGRMK
ncbi:MAG: carbon-nitrogen hydrolase family protein, partial [Bryobacteraceae bacterium]